MTENATEAVAPATANGPARFDVQLNGRFDHEGFTYLPGHHHVVDQTIFDAMRAAGKVANVEQLP